MSPKEIHISKNGKTVGPYTEDQVRNLLKLGMLKPSDQYWHEGMHGWEVLEAFGKSSVPERENPDEGLKTHHDKEPSGYKKTHLPLVTRTLIAVSILALLVYNVNWLFHHFPKCELFKIKLVHLKKNQSPVPVASNTVSNPESSEGVAPVSIDVVTNITVAPIPAETVIASNPTISSETEWMISHRDILPKEVLLTKEVEFPAIVNGSVVGSIRKPSKAVVKLENLDLTNATISFNGGRATMPLDYIDLPELVSRLKPAVANNPTSGVSSPSIQNSNALSISKLPVKQRDFILSQLSSQYLVLENSEVLHIRKPEPVILSSNLSYQKRFSSSTVTDYRLIFDEKELTNRGLFLFDSKVSQSLGDNQYLIEHNNVMLEVPGANHLVDGESVSGLAKHVGTYDYTTVLNAHRRIPRYVLVNFSRANIELLNKMLESGQSFQVVWPVMLRCPQCSGLGKIKSKPDELDYVNCNICEGRREISGGKLYSVIR
jgi:hypothetical protein